MRDTDNSQLDDAHPYGPDDRPVDDRLREVYRDLVEASFRSGMKPADIGSDDWVIREALGRALMSLAEIMREMGVDLPEDRPGDDVPF